METVYEKCLNKIMILKAKKVLWGATQQDVELIDQLDLFLADYIDNELSYAN